MCRLFTSYQSTFTEAVPKKDRLTSSLNGVNAADGVDGIIEISSLNGIIALFVGVFSGIGTGGGGISPSASLNTTIFEPPETTRLAFPACRSVAPLAFFSSGTFSLMRVLRVPISGYGVCPSTAFWEAAPEGSTNMLRRSFGRGANEGTVNTSSCDDEGIQEAARTVRLIVVVDDGIGAGTKGMERGAEDIMRF